ncbi:MAG: hypothetical protein OQJ97_18670 [Rhodospirillales bacterium]|nr:hypothetical protein [Rhodospirillales bacterium]
MFSNEQKAYSSVKEILEDTKSKKIISINQVLIVLSIVLLIAIGAFSFQIVSCGKKHGEEHVKNQVTAYEQKMNSYRKPKNDKERKNLDRSRTLYSLFSGN